MGPQSVSQAITRTTFIQLDTKKCIACWNCQDECKNHVMGRINLPWHKHARFINSSKCTGCLKCVDVCESGALTKITIKGPDISLCRKNPISGLIVNSGLLIFGIAMSFSGFAIQFKYHMGHNMGVGTDNAISGINYYGWSNIHKISVIIISVLVAFHFVLHWQWYKTIVKKRIIARNKLQIILTIVFFLVAITGYVPWIINLMSGSEIARRFFIEIHDKIAIFFFVFLAIHVTKRIKWYLTSIKRFKNSSSN